ncbi:response regulator [Lentilitoribacter sp. Alg239-R112]|uniref:response regulator n=1 Tax=Lentilitoribacter sp. Alg239-R112 TaxID=2305987 RepID=UPI0013A6A2F2|nr:response regulator [Lentilitoribacter sp. Alg239-R112]
MRILFVEDDHVLGGAIRDHMLATGHSVDWMKRKDETLLALQTVSYELILLDFGLPDGKGIDILNHVRGDKNDVPVIISTAQDQIEMRIEGLNSGADDYLVKPYDLHELSARLMAVSRRYSNQSLPAIDIGSLSVNLGRKIISLDGKQLILTAREWSVLERLVRNRGGIVPKADIEDSLYEFGAEIESNAVEVYISRLRKKIGKDVIKTIRGIGYQVEQ